MSSLVERVDKVLSGEVTARTFLGLTEAEGERIAGFGLALLACGRRDDAEACGRVATAVAPRSFTAWLVLACASAQLHKDSRARFAYEQALARNPTYVPAWVAVAELHLRRLDYQSAAAALEQALRLDRQGATAAGRRAQLLTVKTLLRLTHA